MSDTINLVDQIISTGEPGYVFFPIHKLDNRPFYSEALDIGEYWTTLHKAREASLQKPEEISNPKTDRIKIPFYTIVSQKITKTEQELLMSGINTDIKTNQDTEEEDLDEDSDEEDYGDDWGDCDDYDDEDYDDDDEEGETMPMESPGTPQHDLWGIACFLCGRMTCPQGHHCCSMPYNNIQRALTMQKRYTNIEGGLRCCYCSKNKAMRIKLSDIGEVNLHQVAKTTSR